MDLPIPPTPPGDVIALPGPVAGLPAPPATGVHAEKPSWLRVLGNLVLLPLRLLRRLAQDLMAVLSHLLLALWEAALGILALSLILGLMAVESFGENFFIGEVFQQLFPRMKAYVPEASAIGMVLAALFPLLGEVRASTIFAFIVAFSAVAATALVFHFLKRWQQLRAESSPVVQEALLLDPEVQEAAPPPPKPSWPKIWALIGLGVGGGVELVITAFEIYALTRILGVLPLGFLSALLLLGIRVVVGFLAHVGFSTSLLHLGAATQHVEGMITRGVSLLPNLIEETLHRLENLTA